MSISWSICVMAPHIMAGLLISSRRVNALPSGLTGQEKFAHRFLFRDHPQSCSGDCFYGSLHLALTFLLTLGSQTKF